MTKCQNCGRLNPDRAAFCDLCGKPLPTEQAHGQSVQCPKCGAFNPVSETSCIACAADLSGLQGNISPARPTVGSRDSKGGWLQDDWNGRSQIPTIAAVLMIGAGILDLVGAVRELTMRVPATDLPIDFSGWVLFCGTLGFVLALIVIAGAFLAYKRISFTFTVIATIAGMLAVGPFLLGFIMSLIALVLVALSRDDFAD